MLFQGKRGTPSPRGALGNHISGLCGNRWTPWRHGAASRRSKPRGALAGVVAGHCVLAFGPLHKLSLSGWHLQQAGGAEGSTRGHISAWTPGPEWERVRV